MNASKIDQHPIVCAKSPDIRLLDSPAFMPDVGAAIAIVQSQRLADEVIERFNAERRFTDLPLTTIRRSTLTVQQRLLLDRQLSRLTSIAAMIECEEYRSSSKSANRLGRAHLYILELAAELEPLITEQDEYTRLALYQSDNLSGHLDEARASASRIRQLRMHLRAMQNYLSQTERAGCDIHGSDYQSGPDPKWDAMAAKQDLLQDEVLANLPALCSWARSYDLALPLCGNALRLATINIFQREQQLWGMEEEMYTLVASLEGRSRVASSAPRPSPHSCTTGAEDHLSDTCRTDSFKEPDQLTIGGQTYRIAPPPGLLGDAVRRAVICAELAMSDLFRGGRAMIWDEELHDLSDLKRRQQVQRVRRLFGRLEAALLSATPTLRVKFTVTKAHLERSIHPSDDDAECPAD
jgi:hypothetical protein